MIRFRRTAAEEATAAETVDEAARLRERLREVAGEMDDWAAQLLAEVEREERARRDCP